MLVILATITIQEVGGDGIFAKAKEAARQTDIANEKEKISLASLEKIIGNKSYQEIFNETYGLDKVEVIEDTQNGIYQIKYKDSGRIYLIENDKVSYLATEKELNNKAIITIDKPSEEASKLFHTVNITITTLLTEDANIKIEYDWKNEDDNNDLLTYTTLRNESISGNKIIRKISLTTTDVNEGKYKLYLKVKIKDSKGKEIETTKEYGLYAIKSHDTIVSTESETNVTSGFLGSIYAGESLNNEDLKNLTRDKIKTLTLKNTLDGYNTNSYNTWDISMSKTGRYLAWFTKDSDGMYNVTIAGNGEIIACSNSSNLFRNLSNITKIDGLTYLNTELTTNMAEMFSGNTNLKSLDLSNFNTKNVANMGSMFKGCSEITILNLSKFNTDKVIAFGYMFANCKLLNKLDLSGFNTSSANTMERMFYNCVKISNLNLNNFNTSNVKNMSMMFCLCSSLTKLDVSKFNTSNVTDMGGMFMGCTGITNLDVSNFDTSKAKNLGKMFAGCSSLTELNVSNFDTRECKNIEGMFNGCSNIISLNLSNFNTSNVTRMDHMFYNSSTLKELYIGNWDTNNVISMTYMFSGCSSLTTIYSNKNWYKEEVTSTEMFNKCINLKGSNGSVLYNSSNIDISMANPDTGYFTRKEN